MANNPIQIVLNAQNYVDFSNTMPGGSNKEFYADRDAEFQVHKENLVGQMRSLQRIFSDLPDSELIYAKVEMQSDAWAKSHRPIKKVFPTNKIASVSGPTIGSIVIEVGAGDIQKIIETIESSEPSTQWQDKNGKLVAKPSRARSEVGAIHSIRNYEAADRRNFSIDQALEWLADPRTGGAYYVETFVSLRSIGARGSDETKVRALKSLESFERKLAEISLPIEISRTTEKWTNASLYIIRVITDARDEVKRRTHNALLSFLENEPVVKSIILPPILQSSAMSGANSNAPEISRPDINKSYPVVGIIDSGVAEFPGLTDWCVGQLDFIPKEQQDVSHGTFIAGLVCAGEELNTHPIFNEAKCQYFDLGLHPTTTDIYQDYYPRGFIDFLEQLDAEIPRAMAMGVRIFNMSLAVTTPVADGSYSIFANLLDEIADSHDVLFVLPSGNLEVAIAREEWPNNPNTAATMLLSYRYAGQDRIYQPADSVRAVVVGALNPPDSHGELYPSAYTRKGPGPSLGAKPDIAHVGGRLDRSSGLFSFRPDGSRTQSCGTSYAAPLAAKTIAALDHIIEGRATREMLIALVIHHASIPSSLTSNQLKTVKKDFVGAGVPSQALETLVVDDHEITLVFTGIIYAKQELNFQFSWPASLVDRAGKCSGSVKLTLVYCPPIDREQGGEFVRANLDAFLRQEEVNSRTGKISFCGRLKGDGSKQYEKELVQHGAKWWPVKKFEQELKSVGKSSQWKLVVEPLARSDFSIPAEGIPFTAILTISDPEQTRPVFNEMRQQLQMHGTTISDLRAAARIRSRQ